MSFLDVFTDSEFTDSETTITAAASQKEIGIVEPGFMFKCLNV